MVNFAILLASASIFSFAVATPVVRTNGDIFARAPAHLLPRAGKQFITGPCKSDSDCAAGCCGFNTGKCAGAIIALERDGGCGFGNSKPNSNAAKALGFKGGITSKSKAPKKKDDKKAATKKDDKKAAATKPKANNNKSNKKAGSGKGPGAQFITGPCANDKECASGCCAFRTGKCAGNIIALSRDGGCGFGNSKPNDDAARASGFKGGITSRSGRRGGVSLPHSSSVDDSAEIVNEDQAQDEDA